MGKLMAVYPEAQTQIVLDKLEQQAAEFYQQVGRGLPHLVLLPRTGYEIGPKIARSWGIGATGILHAPLERDGDGFRYGQMPTREHVEGKDLLVIDGVCKSGETLSHVVDLLEFAGAGVVKSAVMMHKPLETTTGYVPDFVGETVEDGAFYVFPWEIGEHLPVPLPPEKPAVEPGVA